MKLTTNYNLIKPELTDSPPDITAMNPNWDAIDVKLKNNEEQIENLDANKADLVNGKVPAEQLPEMNYLSPDGDGKDVIVTFTEAATEADIASGEKLSGMFGKILKKFKNIISGTTVVGKASQCTGNAATATKLQTSRTINGVSFDGTANITVADGTKATTNHASTGTTYGMGNASNYGHVKLSDALDSTYGATSGIAATPNAVKLTNDKLKYNVITITNSGAWTVPPGVKWIDFVLIDGGEGGQGGGSGSFEGGSDNYYGGSGGRGGASGRLTLGSVKISASTLNVIIGAGGAAGAFHPGGTSNTTDGMPGEVGLPGGVTSLGNINLNLLPFISPLAGGYAGNRGQGRNNYTAAQAAGGAGGNGGIENIGFFTLTPTISSGGGGGGGGGRVLNNNGDVTAIGAGDTGGNGGVGAGKGGNGAAGNGDAGGNATAATVYGAGGGGGGGGGADRGLHTRGGAASAGMKGVVYIGYYGF